MNASLTVFLCSTFSDLTAEREAVLSAIRKLQLQHDSMEFFGARASQAIETCLEEVRKSDVLVIIVGFKYGTLVPDRAISFSEAEYSEGYSLGKPCLVYLRNEDVPVLPRHIERDPRKMEALEIFKKNLKERHTVATFTDAADLAVSVAADLSRTVQALEEIEASPKDSIKSSAHSIFEDVNILIRQALEKHICEEEILEVIGQAIKTLLTAEGKYLVSVFLSYSQLDHQLVAAISTGLRAEGLRVWLDQDAISHGDSIAASVREGLSRTDFLVIFLSKNSLNSPWVQFEINATMSRQILGQGPRILPVLLDDVEVPALLRDVKYLDLRSNDVEQGVREISSAIKKYAGAMENVRRRMKPVF